MKRITPRDFYRDDEGPTVAGLIAGVVLALLTAGLGIAWFLGAP
jgi:hypothetical protein